VICGKPFVQTPADGDSGHWGIELIGSKGTARILADIRPRVLVKRAGR
jgi:hypothetical protein